MCITVMNFPRINCAFILCLGAFVIATQSCVRQEPVQEVWPKFLASSTPERKTSGIVHNWARGDSPFSPRLTLDYFVADSSDVIILLLDLNGEAVDTLVNMCQGPGVYEAILTNESSIDSGVYLWDLHIGEYKETDKMILLK